MPSSLLQGSAALLLAVFALGALGGCKATSGGPKSGFYVVTSPTAEFYKYGPAQSFGPDLMLKKGDRVTMLESTWGFYKVLTENGIAGYVASEDLEAAPSLATPRLAAASGRRSPAGGASSGGMSSSRQNRIRAEVLGDPGDPLFNVNDVPLPMPDDLPASGPRPQFRTSQPAPQESGAKPKPRFR